ncbi:ComEA family DNA-binding protein [Candidatus Microgenomates bacterium]|nr:MAG: ComEA family DNA-binding protein [Candidatus Microgenomates bacterium]
MNFHELLKKYSPFFKQHKLSLILAGFGLMFFVYGLIVLFNSSSSSEDIVFESQSEAESLKNQNKEIFADIEGGVVKPGVYSLPLQARIQDLLVSAGGLSAEADRSWVAKNLNLAAKLTDGVKIYIPMAGEALGTSTTNVETINGININTASEQELDSLSGIGLVTAQKIIDNRPYSSIDDLLEKKVVTQKVFEKIKARITIY